MHSQVPTIADIHALVNACDQRDRHVAAILGLFSQSGLETSVLIPEICRFFKQALSLTECSFFWCDQHGLFLDAWSTAPQYLNFKSLMSCARFQTSAQDNWPTLTEIFQSNTACGSLLPFQNARFYDSEYYRSTYQTLNVRHLLDVVVHDGKRPYGVFLFKRSEQLGNFTAQERSSFASLVPMLIRACQSRAVAETQYAHDSHHGFALISSKGEARFMDTEAATIVWSLVYDRPSAFANPHAPSLLEQLNGLVKPLWKPVKQGELAASMVDNRWGRFHFSLEQQQRSTDVIVHLRKSIPQAVMIIGKLYALGLPPLRLMIAWLLVQEGVATQIADADATTGDQNQRIADKLGIKPETAAAHIKALYRANGSQSAQAFVASLLAHEHEVNQTSPEVVIYPSMQQN